MPFATVKGEGPRADVLSGERLHYLRLLDAYGALLTETQREICENYYLYDLSLSEIAEEKGVSKQAVSDALRTSRELLGFYEEKLHSVEQTQAYSLAVSAMMTRVSDALAALAEQHPELGEEIGEVAKLVTVGEEILGEEE